MARIRNEELRRRYDSAEASLIHLSNEDLRVLWYFFGRSSISTWTTNPRWRGVDLIVGAIVQEERATRRVE